jgi:hypothetical protein
MTLVRDLLDLPASLNKSAFVQSLTDGVRAPDQTVDDYAVTDELLTAFRRALSLVKGAIVDRKGSQPIYLDGSFGSGKSHFMAMLDLMLQGHPAPWRKPELHVLRDEHPWVGEAKILQVPIHMVGQGGFEAKVFGAYLDTVRDKHPGAPLPLIFADGPVFDNAQLLRTTLGDDAFFASLNAGLEGDDDEDLFGDVAAGATALWTAERYDAARTSPDVAERAELFTRLTETHFPAYTQGSGAFVGAGAGWNEVSRHAASLGYDGVVLYLDEMILWLMRMLSEPARMAEEFEKLVLLREAHHADRPVPVVAFVARQRKPENLIDSQLVGDERATVFQSMAHHESRFDRVELKDSTLRAIIPHRVVKPRDDAARRALAKAFAKAWKKVRDARADLQANTTEAEVAQVYPFSPALIDVLIVLSDQLQRERTAIRILVELLVEHVADLELGQIVPVGDVFDLIAGGEDAFDSSAKSAFKRARDLYLERVLPFLQREHGVLDNDTCQRARPGHPVRIGCSGCPVLACRRDNRLAKTALLAALAPSARPLADLTLSRLVHLNTGVFGTAPERVQLSMAATTLRKLAGDVPQVRIEGDRDPTVRVSLMSVDTGPILEQAASYDTRQRRRYILRQLLWDQLGLRTDDNLVRHKVDFHSTTRPGLIRFGNVRTLPDDDFRCPADADWQIVIDYPFDGDGYTPLDDERRLTGLRGRLGGTSAHTLVWLPTFFSQRAIRDLGDLCKLEHLLSGNHLAAALTHVPPDEHGRARTDLEALRHRKQTDLTEALAAAYGLVKSDRHEHLLDGDRAPEHHVLALDDGLQPRNPRHVLIGGALHHLAEQILEHRFPHHPHFQAKLTPRKAGELASLLEKLYEDSDVRMLEVSRDERKLLADIAAPLGLCKVLESSGRVEQLERAVDQLEQQRAQAGESEPTVAQTRVWAGMDGAKGLPVMAADLVAWTWAASQRRVLTDHGADQTWPTNGRLPPQAVFVLPELPSAAAFATAIERAGAVFGVTPPGSALKARNVTGFAARVREAAGRLTRLRNTPEALRVRLVELGQSEVPPRLATATVAGALQTTADAASAADLVAALAGADLGGTSLTALARATQQADAVHQALEGAAWHTLGLLPGLVDHPEHGPTARQLREALVHALSEDELNVALAREVGRIAAETSKLLRTTPEPPRGWRTVLSRQETVDGAQALAVLDRLRADLAAALDGAGGDTRLSVRLTLQERE